MFDQAKKTFRLAIPIIIGEVAQMSLGLIDSAMVGAISYTQLAASALVMSVINIPFVFGIGITVSVSQLVSMANGRKDSKMVSHYLFNGFWLCTLTAVIIAGGLELGKDILFHLDQDYEVAVFAVPYLQIMGWGIIPMLMFLALKQFTDGLEYTKTAMILSLSAIPLNFFLNWLFIFGNWGFPRWELYGAGVATFITRLIIFIALLLIVLYHRTFRRYIAIGKRVWMFRIKTMKDLLYIGIPSGFQIGLEAGAFAISGILIGTLGAVSLASHQIALSLASFTFIISLGLSQAGSIRVSNAFGRHDQPLIGAIGKTTIWMALSWGVFCAILFSLFRSQLPFIFNDNAEVVALASTLLLFAALFQISDSTQVITAGLLRGIKDVKVPTVFIFIAYWVIGIPFGYYLTFHAGLGAIGIWIGFITGLTVSALFLFFRFRAMALSHRVMKWKF